MRRELNAYQAIGTTVRLPMYLLDLAAAYQKAGCIEAGLSTLDEAFRHIGRTQERWCEAECYRMRGEFQFQLAQVGHPERLQEAEADLRQALAIAQRQEAQSWALRAAMSLGRLWVQQGRETEAKALLTTIYNSFTEGFETADLNAAKRALDALAS